jgi:hypothetical protein
LPCKKIYPGGVIALADYVQKNHPGVRQRILDLALYPKKRTREKVIMEEIGDFKPKVIVFSWRDIQIFSPDQEDVSLDVAFRFFYNNAFDRFLSGLEGLSLLLMYRRLINENIHYIHMVSRRHPETRIVIGGPAFSVFSHSLIKRLPAGTLGVIGEGERVISKVLSGESNDEIARTERVTFLEEGGRLRRGENTPQYLDIEGCDVTDFDYIQSIFPGLREHLTEVGIQTKRGCSQSCIFCLYPYIDGKTIRYRDPKAVGGEVAFFVKRFGVKRFYFTDSQFIPSKEAIPHCRAVLREISGRCLGINWSGYIRIEEIDHEFAQLLLQSGLNPIELSLTTGSQDLIDKLGLGFKLIDVVRGCRYIKEAGYKGQKIILNLALNVPGETKYTLRQTISLYKEICEIFGEGNVYPRIFWLGIQPHTRLEEEAISKGHLQPGYDPLKIGPFIVKRLIYNPPPLNRLLAKAYLAAKSNGGRNIGRKVLQEIERLLAQ